MEQIDHIAGIILDLIRAVANAILVGLADGAVALRQAMTPLHLTPQVETLVLMLVGLLILLLVLRLFGGALRFLLALVLILAVAQIVLPPLKSSLPAPAPDATAPPAPVPTAPPQK
jgi:hypothetical protein